STAPVVLPGMRDADPRGPAWWGVAGGLWATRARHRGLVHGGVSPVEADHPGGHGRPVRAAPESGDDSASGTGDGAGRRCAGGGRAGLGPDATRRAPR